MSRSRGATLTEMMVALAIMSIVVVAFARLLKTSVTVTTKEMNRGQANEELRRALSAVEEALIHANEVRTASSTFVEFVCDFDHSPGYAREGDLDGDGVPDFRDGDRDGDAAALLPAAQQWQAGFNLKDDDEDGDGLRDVTRRLYLSGRELRLDTSVNEDAWGQRIKVLAPSVSTFTLAYFGNKGNPLGRNVDLGSDGTAATGDAGENDGIISAAEMDAVLPAAGMGNRSGSLDLANERRYLTQIRFRLGLDKNKDGIQDALVETDVYPPLLPLKSR